MLGSVVKMMLFSGSGRLPLSRDKLDGTKLRGVKKRKSPAYDIA
jgi:hypothetical protein